MAIRPYSRESIVGAGFALIPTTQPGAFFKPALSRGNAIANEGGFCQKVNITGKDGLQNPPLPFLFITFIELRFI